MAGLEDYGTDGKNGKNGKVPGLFPFVAVFSVCSVILFAYPWAVASKRQGQALQGRLHRFKGESNGKISSGYSGSAPANCDSHRWLGLGRIQQPDRKAKYGR